MSEKDKILGRIREALTLTAPVPGAHEPLPDKAGDRTQHDDDFRAWLPEVPESRDGQISLFAENSAALKTEFITVSNAADAHHALQQISKREGWNKLAAHHSEAVDPAIAKLDLPTEWVDDDPQVDDLEAADAGISACDMLVAQTGSVVVSSISAGGRALSVLPPHHVVLAHSSQLVADMPKAFERLAELYPDGYPSFLSFITGPSRTGDIERILVLGAHGPKQLTVILVGN